MKKKYSKLVELNAFLFSILLNAFLAPKFYQLTSSTLGNTANF